MRIGASVALSVALLLPVASLSQVLLEDKEGEQISNNLPGTISGDTNSVPLIELNTGDQSLGFEYFTTTKNHDPEKYQIHGMETRQSQQKVLQMYLATDSSPQGFAFLIL